MKFGFIGAGQIGGTLTRRLRALGHEVAIANSRGPETLAALADETGATAVTAEEAVKGRDVIVLTVPTKSVPGLKTLFDGVAQSALIIDTCNYYPKRRDGQIAAIDQGMTEARWVSTQIGHPVIKAFNNINWTRLLNNARPKGDPARIAIPVAGDDAAAKATVMAIIEELGFDAVDAGGLDESWRQQPGQPAYGADLPAQGLRAALAEATENRPAGFTG